MKLATLRTPAYTVHLLGIFDNSYKNSTIIEDAKESISHDGVWRLFKQYEKDGKIIFEVGTYKNDYGTYILQIYDNIVPNTPYVWNVVRI